MKKQIAPEARLLVKKTNAVAAITIAITDQCNKYNIRIQGYGINEYYVNVHDKIILYHIWLNLSIPLRQGSAGQVPLYIGLRGTRL